MPVRLKSKVERRARCDLDDTPEVTDKWVAETNLCHGKNLLRRSRPAGSGQKIQTTLRISKER